MATYDCPWLELYEQPPSHSQFDRIKSITGLKPCYSQADLVPSQSGRSHWQNFTSSGQQEQRSKEQFPNCSSSLMNSYSYVKAQARHHLPCAAFLFPLPKVEYPPGSSWWRQPLSPALCGL